MKGVLTLMDCEKCTSLSSMHPFFRALTVIYLLPCANHVWENYCYNTFISSFSMGLLYTGTADSLPFLETEGLQLAFDAQVSSLGLSLV